MVKLFLGVIALTLVSFGAFAQEVVAAAAEVAPTGMTGFELWSAIATAVISCAAVIAALFPQGKEGSVWFYVRKIIDMLALNFGNAKNTVK